MKNAIEAVSSTVAVLPGSRAGRLTPIMSVAALCLVAVAFFWRIVFLRHALIPIDILYGPSGDPLWQALMPGRFPQPANGSDSDNLMQFYPWAVLSAGALHRGVVPLWNPYVFAGTPFLAALQPAVVYPLNVLLEWSLSPMDVPGVRALLHLALALVGTFLLARRLGQTTRAALLAAIAFGLSLPFVVWLEHPMDIATTWLPWLLLCIDGVIARRGRLAWLLAMSAAVALEVLAGHGETNAHVFLFSAAFALFRLWLTWWRRSYDGGRPIRLLVLLVGAFAVGATISAIQWLPALAQIRISEAAADRSLAAPVAHPWGDPKQWVTLLVAFVPNLFGNPVWHEYLLPLRFFYYNEISLYIGTIPLLLAVIAVGWRRKPDTLFFVGAAVVALGIAVSLPILGMVNALPVFRLTANGRLRLEYALSLAILAGYGLDNLAAALDARRTWRILSVWAVAVVALALAAPVALHRFASGYALLHAIPVVGRLLYRLYPGGNQPDAAAIHALALPWRRALSAAEPALWVALFLLVVWLYHRRLLTRTHLQWAIVAITCVDLFASGIGYHTDVSRAQVAVVPPAVRYVQRDQTLYRVAPLGNALLPSMASLYRLQDVRGYDPTYSAAYERFFAATFHTVPAVGTGPFNTSFGFIPRLAPTDPGPSATRALALLNVKYVLAACSVRLDPRAYRLVYRNAGCVYRTATMLPRAFLVPRVQAAAPERATALLNSGRVDPRRVVLVDPAPTTAASNSSAPAGMARVTRYDVNRVDITVHSSRHAILVLSDAYAPGWKVLVDGHSRPVLRADGILRAVEVGPGDQHVSFIYAPQTVSIGMALAVGGLVLWLALAVVAVWRWTVAIRRRSVPALTALP